MSASWTKTSRGLRLVTLLTIAALASLTLGACGSAPGPRPSPSGSLSTTPDITGIVWQLSDGGSGTGSLLVVGLQGGPGTCDRANVRITRDTTWRTGNGSPLGRPALDRTLIGRQVAVSFTGAVAESYPVQATAAMVTVIGPVNPGVDMTPPGAFQLRGKALETTRDQQGRISGLTILPGESLAAQVSLEGDGASAVTTNVDVVKVTIQVTTRTWWIVDTPTESRLSRAPLIGNGIDPTVDVRLKGTTAVGIVVHLRDLYVGG